MLVQWTLPMIQTTLTTWAAAEEFLAEGAVSILRNVYYQRRNVTRRVSKDTQ